jgi:ribonuclease T1
MSKRATGVLSAVAVVVLTVAVWWLQADDGDGGDGGATRPSTTVSSSVPATSPTNSATSPPDSATSGAGETDAVSGLPYVDLADLPAEAADTLALIDAGGPFPYDADGSTFHNFEGLLPGRVDGYYREYTVETPGSDDRGARRIIGGDEGELYWTEDHYESFEVIRR